MSEYQQLIQSAALRYAGANVGYRLLEEAHGLMIELAERQRLSKEADARLLCVIGHATERYKRRLLKFAFARIRKHGL